MKKMKADTPATKASIKTVKEEKTRAGDTEQDTDVDSITAAQLDAELERYEDGEEDGKQPQEGDYA